MSLIMIGARRVRPRTTFGSGAWVAKSASITETRTQGVIGVYTLQTQSCGWQLFVPNTYRVGLPHGLAIGWHGSGERVGGSDPMAVCMGAYVTTNAATYPLLVAVPQCPVPTQSDGGRSWVYAMTPAIIAATQAEYTVDPRRITLYGWSLGAFNAFELVVRHPTMFAGVLACAGYASLQALTENNVAVVSPATSAQAATVAAQAAGTVPVWHFEGANDGTVTPSLVADTKTAFQASDPNYTYDERAGWDHQATCANPFTLSAVHTWLAAQRR